MQIFQVDNQKIRKLKYCNWTWGVNILPVIQELVLICDIISS